MRNKNSHHFTKLARIPGTSSPSGMSRIKMMKVIELQAQSITELQGRVREVKLEAAHDWTGLLNKEHYKKASTEVLRQSDFDKLEAVKYEHEERRENAISLEGETAVIMFDGANFKGVNDTHGHEAGDELIAYIGKMVSDHFRETDVVGHIGGDEFAITMRNTTKEMIERKMTALNAQMQLPLKKTGFILLPILDFGIHFPESGESINDAMKKADDALYERKQQRKAKGGPTTSWQPYNASIKSLELS